MRTTSTNKGRQINADDRAVYRNRRQQWHKRHVDDANKRMQVMSPHSARWRCASRQDMWEAVAIELCLAWKVEESGLTMVIRS